MKKIVILGAALIASAAAAQTPPTAQPAHERRICVVQGETGSRLGGIRRCATRAQWAADRRAAQATTEHGQNNQANPTLMTPGERAAVNGRYYVGPAGGPQ